MHKRFIMERTIPNIGHKAKEEIQKLIDHSNEVLKNLGPDIVWEESFLTEDKIYCVYQAADEEIIRKHASYGDFPADKVSEILQTLTPDVDNDFYKGKDDGINLNISQ